MIGPKNFFEWQSDMSVTKGKEGSILKFYAVLLNSGIASEKDHQALRASSEHLFTQIKARQNPISRFFKKLFGIKTHYDSAKYGYSVIQELTKNLPQQHVEQQPAGFYRVKPEAMIELANKYGANIDVKEGDDPTNKANLAIDYYNKLQQSLTMSFHIFDEYQRVQKDKLTTNASRDEKDKGVSSAIVYQKVGKSQVLDLDATQRNFENLSGESVVRFLDGFRNTYYAKRTENIHQRYLNRQLSTLASWMEKYIPAQDIDTTSEIHPSDGYKESLKNQRDNLINFALDNQNYEIVDLLLKIKGQFKPNALHSLLGGIYKHSIENLSNQREKEMVDLIFNQPGFDPNVKGLPPWSFGSGENKKITLLELTLEGIYSKNDIASDIFDRLLAHPDLKCDEKLQKRIRHELTPKWMASQREKAIMLEKLAIFNQRFPPPVKPRNGN